MIGSYIKVALVCACGDGPHNFKPWSSAENDTCLAPLSSPPHTKGMMSELREVFSGIELMIRQTRIRDLDHLATVATCQCESFEPQQI
ncbi:hypothetical protein TNCV_630621 [Trichonephila clavipes]|nr:hypothetical protein TNCV_630621 [Trichonephila clavipes]